MLRFWCNKCKAYYRGGAEDHSCPICGSVNVKLIGVIL